MIKSTGFAVGLIAVGLGLLGLSYAWNVVVPQKAVWSTEQAKENADAAASLHEMTHVAGHSDISNDSDQKKQQMKDQLAQAKQRFNDSRSSLDRARAVRQTTASVLRWSGIFLAGVGIIRFLAIRADQDHGRNQTGSSRKRTTAKQRG